MVCLAGTWHFVNPIVWGCFAMRKLMVSLFLICAFCLAFLCVPLTSNVADAAVIIDTSSARVTAYYYLQNFVSYGGFPKTTVDRTPGTLGELYAGTLIENIFQYDLFANTTPKNNNTTTNGVQTFTYFDEVEQKNMQSQNIIYKIVGSNSDKKVVLCASYDNDFAPYADQDDQIITYGEAYSEGINASAASVAVLLTIADLIPEGALPFDVEFVFFGANSRDNAGAKYYTQTMTKEDREQTLLIVDISDIALGTNVYFYSGEFGSIHDKFYSNQLTDLTQFKTGLAGASVDADTPLLYSNPGYCGSTVLFSGLEYNFLHIFAGSYESGVFGGKCEYYGTGNISNTENDCIDYIIENHETDLIDNMSGAAIATINMLSCPTALEELSKTDSRALYNIFANQSVLPWITCIVLIVLIMITICVHYGENSKTNKYAKENNITAVVIEYDDENKK